MFCLSLCSHLTPTQAPAPPCPPPCSAPHLCPISQTRRLLHAPSCAARFSLTHRLLLHVPFRSAPHPAPSFTDTDSHSPCPLCFAWSLCPLFSHAQALTSIPPLFGPSLCTCPPPPTGSYSSNVNLAVENSSWSDESQLQEMYLKRKSFAFNSDRPGVGGEMQRDIFETAMKTVDVTFQVQCLCEAEGIFARPLYLCLSAHHCCPMVCFCVACYVAGLALFQHAKMTGWCTVALRCVRTTCRLQEAAKPRVQ